MTPGAADAALQQRLIAIARDSAWFMDALAAVRSLALGSWCIGAGAVRNLVWDHLQQATTASALSDIDVAHFDAGRLDARHDAALQRQLAALRPALPWEVTNQAAVHLWFESYFGHRVEPLCSLDEAVGSWPEYATCVGLYLDGAGALQVIAPHGLSDLFSMTVRRNPTRVSVATYRQRVAEKRYQARWPGATIIAS